MTTPAAVAQPFDQRNRGGGCAIARTKAGGRVFMAQGDIAPFMVATFTKLAELKLGEYERDAAGKATRFRLFE
jgi:hypothetical protein